MHPALRIALAGVLALAGNAAGAHSVTATRDLPVPQAPGLQAELDARAAATAARESTWDRGRDKARFDSSQSGAFVKAGFVGEREGDLDVSITSFLNEPGIVAHFTDYGGRGPEARAFAISQHESNALILAGQVGTPDSGGRPTRIAIFQLLQNGVRDPGFAGSGVQTFDISNSRLEVVDGFALTERVHGVIWDRVYLLARDFENAARQRFALICYRRQVNEPAFEACPDFGAAGVRYYAFGLAASCPSDNSIPGGIHLDRGTSFESMRIIMVGSAQRTFNGCGDHDFGIVRVRMNGNPDTDFSDDGYATVFTNHSVDSADPIVAAASTVTVRSDSRIVVGGSTSRSGVEDALLVQLTSSGTLNSSFCSVGDATCDSPPAYRGGRRGFSAQPRGRVTALINAAGFDDLFVARTLSTGGAAGSGRLRRIEGSGGCNVACNEVNMLPVTGGRFVPVSVLWQPSAADGQARLTVGGTGTASSDGDVLQAYVYRYRFTASGLSADAAWVTSGAISWRQDMSWPNSAPTPIRDATVSKIVFDRQERVLVAGGARTFASERDMAMARLQGDARSFRDGFE